MAECAWCGPTRPATMQRSQTFEFRNSKLVWRGSSQRRRHESAAFTVPLPCCEVCSAFLDAYERKTHWALRFVTWFLPLCLPIYMFASHFNFSLSQMRLAELVGMPIIMMMIFFAVHVGIGALNLLFSFEFRMTYSAIRAGVSDKPSGMIGRLGTQGGRNTILAGTIGREGDFGSKQYRIRFYRDISVALPIEGRLKKQLVWQGVHASAPFSFDRMSGPLQLVPYFLGLYIIPAPVLLLLGYSLWTEYSFASAAYQLEQQTLAFEESVLQHRLDGQPMTRAACEAQAADDDLCSHRGCVPVSEGQPYWSADVISIGQTPHFCPTLSVLEENVERARQSLDAIERYSPPINALVPSLLALAAAALVMLFFALEALRHLLAFTRRGRAPTASDDTSPTKAGASSVLLAGGCLMAVVVSGGGAVLLATVAYFGIDALSAAPEWEVPPLYSDETSPERQADYQQIDASMRHLEPWLTTGCPASPQTRLLVEIAVAEAHEQESLIIAARIREGGTPQLSSCVLTYMQSGVSVSRAQTQPLRVSWWFTWP